MSCVNVQYIDGDECIGASLPKINGNFAALSAAVCDLSANIPDSSVNVVDSPTIDLDWNASTRTLSASISSINSFFTGTNQGLTTNGYQKLPGGLIIQWGVSMVAYGTVFTGSFPVAFPTNVLNMTSTSAPNIPPQTTALIFVQNTPSSLSTFKIVSYHINLSTGSNAVYWLAIGY